MSGPYGPCVRVRATLGPLTSVHLNVEVKDQESGWRLIGSYNDMRDYQAHERADQLARAARRSLIEGETP